MVVEYTGSSQMPVQSHMRVFQRIGPELTLPFNACAYNIVCVAEENVDSKLPELTSIKRVVNETFEDPILDILLKNSNLTRKQFETFLIDLLSDDLLPGRRTSIERSKLRTDRDTVSRGSFDRTLTQARKNVTESIYTVLLLGYAGLLETSQLEPFLETGNRLKSYSDERRERPSKETQELQDSLLSELSEVLMMFVGRRKQNQKGKGVSEQTLGSSC